MKRSRYEVVPLLRAEANAFIQVHHRHHKPPTGDLLRLGARLRERGGDLLGVVVIGRPSSRILASKEPRTVELVRVCNVEHQRGLSSFLLGAGARLAFAAGYLKVITYTLTSESGKSLRGAGYKIVAEVDGRSWSCPSRPRVDAHPLEDKLRWALSAP